MLFHTLLKPLQVGVRELEQTHAVAVAGVPELGKAAAARTGPGIQASLPFEKFSRCLDSVRCPAVGLFFLIDVNNFCINILYCTWPQVWRILKLNDTRDI